MRCHYYAETDSLYIEFSAQKAADSQEVAPGVVLDFGAARELVGIDIDRASRIVDLSRLEAEGLPLRRVLLSQQGSSARASAGR